jgi:hypothetical protein
VGVPSADGTTVAFTIVAALAGRNSLDLALVPAIGDPTPFQVLFKSDDPNALTWQPVHPVQSSNSLPAPQQVGAAPASVPAASHPAEIAPGAPELAALPPSAAAPPVTVGARTVGAQQVTVAVDQRLVLLLLAALLAVVAVIWSRRLRALISSDTEAVRGIGRFASARAARARPL